jgi:hypothetical protein
MKPNVEKQRYSRQLVDKIVKRYPDYGKHTTEYIFGLIELLSTYPEEVQEELADIRIGISARTKFLPTPAEIVELGNEIEQRLAHQNRPRGPLLVRDTRPYNPQQIPVYLDRYNNRISEREAEEKADAYRSRRDGMKRAERMLEYVKHLGNGSLLDGWIVLQERGETEPPSDWEKPA